MGFLIWAAAALAYGLFLAWYVNWRPPLSPEETAAILEQLKDLPTADPGSRDSLAKFLADDDGREFFMLNVIKVEQGQVTDPKTGTLASGNRMLMAYFRQFARALLARGGHPAISARKTGGYVDAWNTPPDPGWTQMGYMRYRSRRDLAALILDPRFKNSHPYKIAAIPETFSFPTRPQMMLLMSPRIWVGLVLALIAALSHLIVLAA